MVHLVDYEENPSKYMNCRLISDGSSFIHVLQSDHYSRFSAPGRSEYISSVKHPARLTQTWF